SKDLNNILTKINQIPNISENNLLLLIRCKIHIELNKYYEAKADLNMLFDVCEFDINKLGIINEFSKYMYYEKEVYFISNLKNLNSELCQFQESDINSLSGLVLCSKNEKLRLDLPRLYNYYYLICKINVKKILSKDCFIKFILQDLQYDRQEEHMLKHEDVSKLEGLDWIEYNIPKSCRHPQLSIEINSIEM
ncbi:hypothetical protein RhiirC2_802490, partial [Rhizophagus irregularis]